jgi:hypothetical protein
MASSKSRLVDLVVVEPALDHLPDGPIPGEFIDSRLLDVLDAIIGQMSAQEPLAVPAMVRRIGFTLSLGVLLGPRVGILSDGNLKLPFWDVAGTFGLAFSATIAAGAIASLIQ